MYKYMHPQSWNPQANAYG